MSRGRTRTRSREPRPQRGPEEYIKPLQSATSAELTGEGPEHAADYRSWRVRCRAKSRQTGLPCRNWARRFATVCGRHGGSSLPSVIEAAERRRAALATGVAATLEDLLEGHRPQMVRLAVAKLLMLQMGLPVAARRKREDISDPEIEQFISQLQQKQLESNEIIPD